MPNNEIPLEADVVVVGGGIVGCAASYYLSRRGMSTALFEKDEIGRGQSGRNWGFVRQQGRDPSELPLMIEANRIWCNATKELGADVEWMQGGNLALAATAERMALFEGWRSTAREHGLDTEILGRAKLRALIPGMEGDWLGGMYTASDGHAEPRKATLAFCAAAKAAGARVFEHCAALRVNTENGGVSEVWTEKGRVRTRCVIGAAGAWSAKLVSPLGLHLPQRWVRSTVARTNAMPRISDAGVWAPGVAFRQRRDGTLNLGGGGWADHDITLDSLRDARLFLPNYWRNRKLFQFHVGKPLFADLLARLPGTPERRHPFSASWAKDPPPNPAKLERMLGEFRKMFPTLADLTVTETWAGYMDATPDALPVLGTAESPRGFVFATGFSGHGFGLGPVAGRLVAELIAEGKTSLGIDSFRFSRFAEGAIGEPRSVL